MNLVPLAAALYMTVMAALAPQDPQGIHGRVVDPEGRTVGGATVLVVRGDKVVARVVTPDGIIAPIALPRANTRSLSAQRDSARRSNTFT